MPRVKPSETKSGCLVIGRIFGGQQGIIVTISLERSCMWRDTILPMRFEVRTDAMGRFELRLPPTDELRAQDGGQTPLYQFTAEQIGSWLFAVPAQETWSLADG